MRVLFTSCIQQIDLNHRIILMLFLTAAQLMNFFTQMLEGSLFEKKE